MQLRVAGRRAPVLVLLHDARCAQCAAYLDELTLHHDSIAEWDGRVLAVGPDTAESDTSLTGGTELRFPLLLDPERQVAAALSIQAPAVVIADQWGEVHSAEEAGPEHRFPTPEDVISWVRYLAIQCPECQGEAY